MPIKLWGFWAVLLIFQNFAFTIVSRARNSGSLKRHIIAAFFSNGVWFVAQIFTMGAFFNILTGKYGWAMSLWAAVFYTAFTITGSIAAHYWSLRSEKGAGAVGASKKYAQITVEEWTEVRKLLTK